MHKTLLKNMVHTIKPTNLCIKHNPKSLQKQHGYKNTLYTEKYHQYIKYTKVSKPSISYKFKLNINHNHSVSNPTHNNNNYPKHKTITIKKKTVKTGMNICEHSTPPFNMHTSSHSYAVLPLTMCYSPHFWHE